ncbi:N-acetylmuramoyl-L-alanine amidase [Arvimicrobium flavum]|uniref:N-acetylmuramoyl-L-alanine amidase n=1 Tax=Arvimicrobium flavum TaxID=3393320 RepID=UPI00237B24BC|nr:N-acetylmuramoyl-L-alanine amidase [Mesorhizobium shangrilense]
MGSAVSVEKHKGYLLRNLVFLALVLFATLLAGVPAARATSLEAHAYKIAGDASRVRIVMQFDREPEPRWFLLRGPHRLVVDLPETTFRLDHADLKPHGLVANARFGAVKGGVSRLVISAKGPFSVEKVDVLPNEDAKGYRLAIDLVSVSAAAFDQALADQALVTASSQSTPKTERLPEASKRFVIVLDPGHGGADGGAEGAAGTVEKAVTLAFAKELREVLEATGKYDVSMTRESDQFLRLDDRVRIARERSADLLVSIHADTINLKGIRGATVYTVSDKASDPEAEALAIRENLADQVAGIDIQEADTEVADILVDLIRRETHSFSIRFARTLVGELTHSIGVINNPHRFAGFRVLKAPDVPSVLVELGYLSNAKDEKLLQDADWRRKAAESISKAVAIFAGSRAGAG